jgi:Na+/H+-translocating membrane pyrophosphatase
MKPVFYVNPDVLSNRGISKFDIAVIVGLLCLGALSVSTYLVTMNPESAPPIRLGLAFSYAGVLTGIFGHLGVQIKKADEFGQRIFNKSIAAAGLTTILIVCGLTIFWLAFDLEDAAMFSIYAPFFFLVNAWIRSRKLARSFTTP